MQIYVYSSGCFYHKINREDNHPPFPSKASIFLLRYGSINHIKINSDSTLELVKSVADNDAIASGTNKNAK